MKLNLKNYQDKDLVLLVFTFIYALGIFVQLCLDYNFNVKPLSLMCGPITSSLNWSPQVLYWLLLGFLVASPFVQKKICWIWAITACVYFICIRDFLVCQAGPEKAYMAWNHAIVFWIFCALSFQKILGSQKTIFLIKFFLIFSYFAGGLAKIRHGLDWMNGWTLQFYFLQRHIDLDTPLAWALVSNFTLSKVLSYLVVVTELLVPLAFINKKLEWFFVVSFFIFQIICWQVLKLKWMNYYGWSYLIYVSIAAVAAARYFESKSKSVI